MSPPALTFTGVTSGTTRIAVFEPADGALNFARDEALLAQARATGLELIRIYGWDRPVVSFGRNERAAQHYDPVRLREAGIDAARRLTGGRALLHNREITYAIAGPASPDDPLRNTYARIAEILRATLTRLGVEVRIAGGARTALPDGSPCFAEPARGELLVNGRKLVASAQWREAGAYLQHGSILIDDDQAMLARGARIALPPVSPPATLRHVLGRAPTLDEFGDALAAVIAREHGRAPERVASHELLPAFDIDARLEKYRDHLWTWRR